MTPDRIFVSGIECRSAIGVTAAERSLGQRLSIDVEVQVDLRGAAGSDSVEDTLDYGRVVARVVELAGQGEYKLLETLAERIAGSILGDLGGDTVRVLVRKLAPPLPTRVGFTAVEIVRSRSGAGISG